MKLMLIPPAIALLASAITVQASFEYTAARRQLDDLSNDAIMGFQKTGRLQQIGKF